MACSEVLVAEYIPKEGGCATFHRGHLIAVVASFLIGCAILASHSAEAAEEGRCEGTRFIVVGGARYTTNDISGCPKGGLLSGTGRSDALRGMNGDDEVRGRDIGSELYGGEGNDTLYGGAGEDFIEGEQDDDVLYGGDDSDILLLGGRGDDVIYGGDGKDYLDGNRGDDVIHGGDGNEVAQGPPWDPIGSSMGGGPGEDVIYGGDGKDYLDGTDWGGKDKERDELYCGAGRDQYLAGRLDYVSSSCEEGELVDTGGPPLILLAGAALLMGSGLAMSRYVIRRAS